MQKVLHILVGEDVGLARAVIDEQRKQPDLDLTVIELGGPEPDYRSLLKAIFEADSIHRW